MGQRLLTITSNNDYSPYDTITASRYRLE